MRSYTRLPLFGLLLLSCAAPAQSPAPAQPALITQFQKLEDSWSIALAHRDQYALENLLSPNFIDVSAAAQVSTRNQSIVDALGGQPEPVLSVEQKVVNVRTFGDVAVVEGTYMLRLKEAPRTRDERGVFTHVWEKGRGNWSCVSAQRTAVVDELEGGRKAAGGSSSGKASGAALPFHIPLVYKGADAKTPAPAAPAPPGTIPPASQDNPAGAVPPQ